MAAAKAEADVAKAKIKEKIYWAKIELQGLEEKVEKTR